LLRISFETALTLILGAPSTVTTHPKAKNESSNYFFLYPAGHFGPAAITRRLISRLRRKNFF